MRNSPRFIDGNALVETSLLMLVMLPLIYAMVLMGNLIDLKQTNEQAARYTAWESTIHPNGSSKSDSVRLVNSRFYGSQNSAISSKPARVSQHNLWGDKGHSDKLFSDDFRVEVRPEKLLTSSEYTSASSSPSANVGLALSKSGENLENVVGNSWGLTANGVLSSTVGVSIDRSDWLPLGGADCGNGSDQLCMSSKSAILNDEWSASDDSHAKSRIRSLMPSSVLQPIGDIVSVAGKLPLFEELKDLKGAFGHVDMSILPEYELR